MFYQYEKDKELSEWFRCVCALALLPMPLVDDECERLMLCAEPLIQRYPNLRKWCDYYINTYHEGKFPISLWHHFKTVGPRTNNHLEGYNNRLKTLSTAHPDIFSSIDLFRAEKERETSYLMCVGAGSSMKKNWPRSSLCYERMK